jgi:hypothetical protein
MMTSLVVTKIKHDVKRNKILSERDANILFATMDAQTNRMAELEAALCAMLVEFAEAAETHDLMQARRACILAAYRRLTAEQQANVCEELAELGDPDTVDGTSTVSEWQDERNSRPAPF